MTRLSAFAWRNAMAVVVKEIVPTVGFSKLRSIWNAADSSPILDPSESRPAPAASPPVAKSDSASCAPAASAKR